MQPHLCCLSVSCTRRQTKQIPASVSNPDPPTHKTILARSREATAPRHAVLPHNPVATGEAVIVPHFSRDGRSLVQAHGSVSPPSTAAR